MKRYLENATNNTRDIGGYKTNTGYSIKEEKIIRSDAPILIGKEEIEELLTLGISTVIDFRSKQEYEKRPCPLENDKRFCFYHCSIKGDGKIPCCEQAVPQSYMEMIEGKEIIKEIIEIIAKAKGGILYFCTAGKDRTGVVTALILSLLEVSQEDIIQDYQLSAKYLKEVLKEYAKKMPKELANVIEPKASYMKDFLIQFHQRYQDVEGYLLQAGVNKKEIEELRKQLIRRQEGK